MQRLKFPSTVALYVRIRLQVKKKQAGTGKGANMGEQEPVRLQHRNGKALSKELRL